MWQTFKRWWLVGRHVRALHGQSLVVVDSVEWHHHTAQSRAFADWVLASGALNDGVPRRTRKLVVRGAKVVLGTLPSVVGG